MDFIINETNEYCELLFPTGGDADISCEIIGDSGAIGDSILYDDDIDRYRISQEDFNWWAEYINYAQNDMAELDQLCDLYGRDAVCKIINRESDWYSRDYDLHHVIAQQVYGDIRAELGA